MACKPYHSTKGYTSHGPTKVPSFPQPPAASQPPLLPLPKQQATPPYSFWPPATASRPAPPPHAKKPRCYDAAPGLSSAPVSVAAPSKKRAAPATEAGREEAVEWAEAGSLYSVSPPPSSVPMPTSLLLAAAAGRKAPTACAVEVAGGVDAGATDELRRLLRL